MKHTRITALVLAVCLCAAAMTACGDNNSDKTAASSKAASIDDMNEEELDAALDKIEKDTAEQIEKEMKEAEAESAAAAAESEAEPVVAEKTYEPTEEIKNASFRSGYIQIGDTVFRTGGYIRVAEFIEKYGDKFDLSEIKPDEYLKGNKYKDVVISSVEDPRISIKLQFMNIGVDENDRIKISDTVIREIVPFGEAGQFTFYPTGVNALDYDAIKSLVAELGLEETKSSLGVEAEKYSESNDYIYAPIYVEEENLYGKKPVLGYKFYFDPDTLVGTSIELQYRSV